MPDGEDLFALKDVFVVDNLLSEHISIVRDLGPHVVDQEWFSECVFVVRVGHGLEVESHHGT